jgi:predicted metal-dependent phosphoesterase TrpH
MILADLHIHTIYSNDSSITPRNIIECLVNHNSVKVAAVTDHDTTIGLEETIKLATPYPDILIIPGVEISTLEGDILILGTKKLPKKPWTIDNVINFARKNGAVSIVAHPYREYGMGDIAREFKFDAVEIFNGESKLVQNKMAKILSKEMKIPGIAGSDAHDPLEICSVYTQINASLNEKEIIEAIKKGLVSIPSKIYRQNNKK